MKLLHVIVAIVAVFVNFAYSKGDCNDLCKLPSETGMCRAALQRYYFNSKSGQCETFTYGGCNGNENNFETLEECEDECLCDQD